MRHFTRCDLARGRDLDKAQLEEAETIQISDESIGISRYRISDQTSRGKAQNGKHPLEAQLTLAGTQSTLRRHVFTAKELKPLSSDRAAVGSMSDVIVSSEVPMVDFRATIRIRNWQSPRLPHNLYILHRIHKTADIQYLQLTWQDVKIFKM